MTIARIAASGTTEIDLFTGIDVGGGLFGGMCNDESIWMTVKFSNLGLAIK